MEKMEVKPTFLTNDLAALVRKTCDRFLNMAEDQHIRMDVTLPETAFPVDCAAEMVDKIIGMMKQGATISMEAWNAKAKPNLDWNHSWGAVALNIISRHVLGVTPLEPGARKISICPRLGHLKSVSATVPTAAGSVTITMTPERLDFTSPSATVVAFAGETREFQPGRHAIGVKK